ncbi:MAG: phosphoadenosine phosphosulfate reductase [Alphaproteobacteria bacterium RIFCSPHIGHO2_12_FULL_63_12]|nr:MAG: phosphoadenosine phosphosulfate reductase [Alphaproteobacteria bacterium RIFCSPHIGHO2_12_FULL_63_12]
MTAAALKLPLAPAAPLSLEARAETLNREAQDLAPREIVAATLDEFRGRIALVSSFGAESAALLHLVASVDPSTPVLFIDTEKHFVQTNAYREELTRLLGLVNVLPIRPDEADLSRTDPRGDLWKRDNDACCALRKVRPLRAALNGYDAWITGRKRIHGSLRSFLPLVETAPPHIKINPLARWSADDLDEYMTAHGLPAHPLVENGFSSIGCWPCTAPTAPGDNARAGRWRGLAKTECGIHRL